MPSTTTSMDSESERPRKRVKWNHRRVSGISGAADEDNASGAEDRDAPEEQGHNDRSSESGKQTKVGLPCSRVRIYSSAPDLCCNHLSLVSRYNLMRTLQRVLSVSTGAKLLRRRTTPVTRLSMSWKTPKRTLISI
jgi:hypothetical protein